MGSDNTLDGTRWLVRKSTDSGRTWTLSDTFQLTSGRESIAEGFVTDVTRNIYAVGVGYTPAGANWLVRKLAP